MRWSKIFGAAAFAAALSASTTGEAAVLYTTGSPNGNVNGWTINSLHAVADSFTLTQASTVTGVDFVTWAYPGDTLTSVDWSITTAADWSITTTAGVFPAGKTTASVTQSSICSKCAGGYFYDLNNESFSTGGVSLAAGTYYLVLQNADLPNGNGIFWDENGAPSVIWYAYENVVLGQHNGSQTFQILGTTSAVPEPSTWATMLVGFLGLGFAGYRRSRRVAA